MPVADPLIFRPKVGPKGRKKKFETAPPPSSSSQSLDDRAPTLYEGLDPPLGAILNSTLEF